MIWEDEKTSMSQELRAGESRAQSVGLERGGTPLPTTPPCSELEKGQEIEEAWLACLTWARLSHHYRQSIKDKKYCDMHSRGATCITTMHRCHI